MRRFANLVAWIIGAIVSAVVYRYVAVYLLGEFDHAYGKLASLQLSLVLSALFVVAGLVGYAAVASFRQRPASFVATFFAGVAFTVCVWVFAFALAWVFPNRDMAIPGLAGALLLGALSILVARPSAA
jgi:hypothetical protein